MISVLAFCVLLSLASGEQTSGDQETSGTFHPHLGLLAHHRFKKHLQALYPLGYAFGLGLGHHMNFGHYGPGFYGNYGNFGNFGNYGTPAFHGLGHYRGIGGYGFPYRHDPNYIYYRPPDY